MPLPVLDGVLRITVSGQMAGGGQWANTWHCYHGPGDWTTAEIDSFHSTFVQFYVGPSLGVGGVPVTQFLHSTTTIDHVNYTPLDGTSGAYLKAVTAVGLDSGQQMPAEVAEVITIRTAARGRQNRGRVYLPALCVTALDTVGKLGVSVTTGIINQITAVNTSLVTGGAGLGVGSYGPYKNPITHITDPTGGGTSAPHFTAATAFTMDELLDVQRNRKR